VAHEISNGCRYVIAPFDNVFPNGVTFQPDTTQPATCRVLAMPDAQTNLTTTNAGAIESYALRDPAATPCIVAVAGIMTEGTGFPLLSQPQFPPPDSFRMSGSEIFNLNNDSACLKVARGRKR
jgi:hypothetical protein